MDRVHDSRGERKPGWCNTAPWCSYRSSVLVVMHKAFLQQGSLQKRLQPGHEDFSMQGGCGMGRNILPHPTLATPAHRGSAWDKVANNQHHARSSTSSSAPGRDDVHALGLGVGHACRVHVNDQVGVLPLLRFVAVHVSVDNAGAAGPLDEELDLRMHKMCAAHATAACQRCSAVQQRCGPGSVRRRPPLHAKGVNAARAAGKGRDWRDCTQLCTGTRSVLPCDMWQNM
jgi:hypothetical protein